MGGRFALEQVAALLRDGWPDKRGMLSPTVFVVVECSY